MPLVGRSPAPVPEFARSSGGEGGKGIKTEGVRPPEAKPKGRRVSGAPARKRGRKAARRKDGETVFSPCEGEGAALLFPSSRRQTGRLRRHCFIMTWTGQILLMLMNVKEALGEWRPPRYEAGRPPQAHDRKGLEICHDLTWIRRQYGSIGRGCKCSEPVFAQAACNGRRSRSATDRHPNGRRQCLLAPCRRHRAGSQSDAPKQRSGVDFRGTIFNCPGGITIIFQCGWWQWQVSDSSSG